MPRNIRPIRLDGNIAYVPLTRGYEAIIDAADAPLVEGFNWSAMVAPRSVYAKRNDRTGDKARTVQMHRVILSEPEGLEVDHIDGDGLNNTRDNLRVATKAQNQHNRRINRDNTSGLKGVSWCKHAGKCQARITINGKLKHLGYFNTKEEAHAAYCEASAKFHKEFGRTE
jgi:hypothetical protein